MRKKSRQKFKYIKNEKSFKDEIKKKIIISKGHSLKQITFLKSASPTLILEIVFNKIK